MLFDEDGRRVNPGETPSVALPGQLEMTVGSQDDTFLWQLFGEVDMASVPRLYGQFDAIAPEAGSVLIVDLSGVTFLDSSGLAFLIFVHEECATWGFGAQLRILNPTPGIRRLFDITGLSSVLSIEPPQSDQS